MPTLTLAFLGSPHIELEGQTITVDTRKATALLAYLTVTGEAHTREALATLLYPDYDQSRGRAALRRTLSALNKALGPGWIDAQRASIGLNPDAAIEFDIATFNDLVRRSGVHTHEHGWSCNDCIDWLSNAVELYRGDFLEGFTLRDSANFDDWQFFEAEGLRLRFANVLEKLVTLLIATQAWDQAISYTRRWLALDSLHEPAHRQLMRLYAWNGQQAAALRQYRECVRILDEELGTPPLEETTDLYHLIQENRLEPSPTASVSPSLLTESPPRQLVLSPANQPPPALVGRTVELARLYQSYDTTSGGRLIVIQGEAGIGKTRLTQELLRHVRERDGVILSAQCYEGETNLAFAPILNAIRPALAQPQSASRLEGVAPHALSEAARLLPEITRLYELPPAQSVDNPGAQSRFFDGLSQTLDALLDGPAPGVLFIDNVHWADAASLDLLAYLIRRLRQHDWMLLLTWRSEYVTEMQQLPRLAREIQRENLAESMELQRLEQEDVAALVRKSIETDQAETLSEQLFRETEGLPFMLIEYLSLLANENKARTDVWDMPEGVRDLLRSRLFGLSEVGRQALTTAAVIGRSFDFDTLLRASGRSDEETINAIEELNARTLIITATGPQGGPLFDFSHEKLRSLVYEETSFARRRLLHRRVAEAIRAENRQPDVLGVIAGQLAHHYRLAGQEEQAASFYKLAGDHARSLYANTEALEHYDIALALGYAGVTELHEARGDLQVLRGDYGAALRSYEQAAALSGEKQLAGLERRMGEVYHRRGDWTMAELHYELALQASEEGTDPGLRSRIYADWSLNFYRQGDPAQAVHLAEKALVLAQTAGEVRALARAHNLLGLLATNAGVYDEAITHLRKSLTLAETINDIEAQVAALNNLALVYKEKDDIAQALTATQTALELCTTFGDRHRQAALHNNLADLLHDAREEDAAMAQLKQAVRLFAEIGASAEEMQPEIWKLAAW